MFRGYILYTWKLNHGQTIWDRKWGAIRNVLRDTLGTQKNSNETLFSWTYHGEEWCGSWGCERSCMKEGSLFVCLFGLSCWDLWIHSACYCALDTLGKPLMRSGCAEVVWQFLDLWCKSYWILKKFCLNLKKKKKKIKTTCFWKFWASSLYFWKAVNK